MCPVATLNGAVRNPPDAGLELVAGGLRGLVRARSGSFLACARPGVGMHPAESSTSMKGAVGSSSAARGGVRPRCCGRTSFGVAKCCRCRCVGGASHDVSPADPERQRFALAAAAHSGSAEPAAGSAKLVAQVQRDPGAGGSEWMAEGDRAAVDVHLDMPDVQVSHGLDGDDRTPR
jgi:hypothetical protein